MLCLHLYRSPLCLFMICSAQIVTAQIRYRAPHTCVQLYLNTHSENVWGFFSIPPAILTPPAAPLGYRCRWSHPGKSSSCSECCPGEGWLTTARRSLTWRRRGVSRSHLWIFISTSPMLLHVVQGSSEQLTACVWLEETPPSPWPAEASQSHALGLLLQLWSSPAKQRQSDYNSWVRKPDTANKKAPRSWERMGDDCWPASS